MNQSSWNERRDDAGISLSVVMANHNHAAVIGRAIEAIVHQSRVPDEFIILDDGSTDDSVAVIQSYQARFPLIRFERQATNVGVIRAYGILRALASCDYIYPAAADDMVLPGFFEHALRLAQRHPQAGLAFGQCCAVDEYGRDIGVLGARRWQEPTFASPARFREEYLEVESCALSGSTVFRRSAFEAVAGYREELGCISDSFAWYAIALRHGVCYVPRPCSVWYRSQGGYFETIKADPRRYLDLLGRVEHLMRSPEFRKDFPESFVRNWIRTYRRMVIFEYMRGGRRYDVPPDWTWWTRGKLFGQRYACCLRRAPHALALALHRPDLSCFPSGDQPAADPDPHRTRA